MAFVDGLYDIPTEFDDSNSTVWIVFNEEESGDGENFSIVVSGQVVLADGTIVQAKQVLSNATPAVTFLVTIPPSHCCS